MCPFLLGWSCRSGGFAPLFFSPRFQPLHSSLTNVAPAEYFIMRGDRAERLRAWPDWDNDHLPLLLVAKSLV